MAFEALAVIGVAIHWPLVGFRYTHLIKRVGTLTLIILGEGASSVTQTVNKIVGQSGWNCDDFGQTITVIIIIVCTFLFRSFGTWHTETKSMRSLLSSTSIYSGNFTLPVSQLSNKAVCANRSAPSYTFHFTWVLFSLSRALESSSSCTTSSPKSQPSGTP
jgi:hypothetical protein